MSFRLLTRNAEDLLAEIMERLRRVERGVVAVPSADSLTTTEHTHASSGGGGHTIQEDSVSLTARTNLNFATGLVATDDAVNDQTDVDLDYATTAEIADIAFAEAAGSAAPVPHGDHVHAHGTGYRGGHTRNDRTESADYVVALTDDVILVDATGANRTITLPTAASAANRQFDIKKIDASANTVTVDADGSETIDDATTFVLSAQYASVTVFSDGSEWWVL